MIFRLLYTVGGGGLRLSTVELAGEPAPPMPSRGGIDMMELALRVRGAVLDQLEVARVRSAAGLAPITARDVEMRALFVDGRPNAIWWGA